MKNIGNTLSIEKFSREELISLKKDIEEILKTREEIKITVTFPTVISKEILRDKGYEELKSYCKRHTLNPRSFELLNSYEENNKIVCIYYRVNEDEEDEIDAVINYNR